MLRRMGSKLWRLLGVAGDLHFGLSMLVKYVIPSGAVAALFTYAVSWVLSFKEYLAALPFLLQAGFFVCLFIVSFALINHARHVCFLVGTAKNADLIERVLQGDPQFPASRVNPSAGDVTWIIGE